MKLIVAVFRPEKLNAVREALVSHEITRMAITRVSGHGRSRHQTALFRGREVDIPLLPKVRMEIVCNDEFKDEIVDTILSTARTSGLNPGDG